MSTLSSSNQTAAPRGAGVGDTEVLTAAMAAAMPDRPERRPGVFGLGVLGGYGYCRAAGVASNWPRSVLRNRASLPLARTSLRMAA